MGHFVSGCACPGTDEVCFSGRSRFSPHTSPQRPGEHHWVKSVPQGCVACIGKCRTKGFGAIHPNKLFATQKSPLYMRRHCVSCVPFTARSFVLFADLDEPQRFKNRIVLPRKVGRKEKDFVLYRPSLGGCVWMPDGSSELSGFQKRRRLKHTASRRWTSWARRFWWGGTRRSTRCWNS